MHMHVAVSGLTSSRLCYYNAFVMHVVTSLILCGLHLVCFYYPNSGRKLTSQGQRDMDRIAGQVCYHIIVLFMLCV